MKEIFGCVSLGMDQPIYGVSFLILLLFMAMTWRPWWLCAALSADYYRPVAIHISCARSAETQPKKSKSLCHANILYYQSFVSENHLKTFDFSWNVADKMCWSRSVKILEFLCKYWGHRLLFKWSSKSVPSWIFNLKTTLFSRCFLITVSPVQLEVMEKALY